MSFSVEHDHRLVYVNLLALILLSLKFGFVGKTSIARNMISKFFVMFTYFVLVSRDITSLNYAYFSGRFSHSSLDYFLKCFVGQKSWLLGFFSEMNNAWTVVHLVFIFPRFCAAIII